MAVDVEEFYTKYGPMVLRRCRAILKDEEAALDAMQDTFVQVLKKQETLTDEAPSSMLYTFATNICLNSLRRKRQGPVAVDNEFLEQVPGGENPEEKVLTACFLDRLFSTAQESTRRIARLHYVEKRTLEDTAGRVEMSVSGVRRRLRVLRERSLVLREM